MRTTGWLDYNRNLVMHWHEHSLKTSLLTQQINDISKKSTTLEPSPTRFMKLPVTIQILFHQASTLDLPKTKRKTSKTLELHSYSKTGHKVFKLDIAFSIRKMGVYYHSLNTAYSHNYSTSENLSEGESVIQLSWKPTQDHSYQALIKTP